MTLSMKLTAATLAAGTMLALASPAPAAITTFATFSPIGQSANVQWVNSSGTTGSGGTFYSTATAVSTVVGTRNVQFSFLDPTLAPFVTNITAAFTLNASVPNGNPAVNIAGFLIQDGVSGSFSFLTTSPILIDTTFYATGSNLLSATFGSTAISGQLNGTSGSSVASTSAGDTLVYTSDFINFSNVSGASFSVSLNSLTPFLQASPAAALQSFRAVAGGGFDADITAVPEPGTWAMLLVGFGMIGAGVRSRKRQSVRVTFA